jgi:hypothetical protein
VIASTTTGSPAWVEVLAALSPFLLLVLGGVGWLYRHEHERRTAVERQLSEHKYRVYIELLNIFYEQFQAVRDGKGVTADAKLVNRMMDANRELIMYGSDDVALTYLRWLDASKQAVESGASPSLRGFGEVVVAIRRDMGNKRTKLTADDVLRQLITDYDTVKAQGLIY